MDSLSQFSFLFPSLLAGIGLMLAAGPLGAFVLWRKMAFFGEALAHSALLGIALALLLDIHIALGITAITFCFALLLFMLMRNPNYSSDTLLGIIGQGALATGLIVVALVDNSQLDIMAYLFGDILVVSTQDLWIIYGSLLVIWGVLAVIWKRLLLVTIHKKLAAAHHINTRFIELLFMMMVSLLVALSIKIVGVLLITSLLIIPAATARYFSHTPEQMVVQASLLGVVAVFAGLFVSLLTDAPTGPIIIVMSIGMFIILGVIKRLVRG